MPFKSYQIVKWRDVKGDERVRTRDGYEWIVCVPWNGTSVMLAKVGALNKVGLPIPVPLVDGDKEVETIRTISRKPANDPVPVADFVQRAVNANVGLVDPKPHEFEGRPGHSCLHGFEDGDLAGTVCGKADWHAWHSIGERVKTATGSAPMPATRVEDPKRAKFGQPKTSGEPMSDAAVIIEAGLGAELLSETTVDVETGSVVHRVPKQLDRLALTSHLYLMHGIYGQDVNDFEALAAVHQRAHATETYVAAHEHVAREEILGNG